MTGAQPPDAVKNLILFVMGLAILGTLMALVWYFTGDLPAHNILLPVLLNAIPTPVDGQIT